MLLLIAVALGVAVALFPVRFFGTSKRSLEYSLEREISGHAISADCSRGRSSRWQCELFDGQMSTYSHYAVRLSSKGCWIATSQDATAEFAACLTVWDYLRIMDR